MISTGNDIVALKAINIARTKEPVFYKKIISASEKDLYHQQFSGKMLFENFVWLLWSVKESAYKYLQRITPELVFSPSKTIISHLAPPACAAKAKLNRRTDGRDFDDKTVYKGVVVFNDHTLYSRSVIDEEFIFSVVNDEDSFDNTCWGIQLISFTDPAHQSKAVRDLLVGRLNTFFTDGDLQIIKSPHGFPIILKNGVEIPNPISLAHHDHYVGYSLQINQG